MKIFKPRFLFIFSAFAALVAFFVLLLPGCIHMSGPGDKGCIEYEIVYPDSMKDDIMASMLPSKMMLKFKPGLTLSELKVGMGIITASIIADEHNKTMVSLFKVIDKKYALKYSQEKTKEELDKLPKFSIKYLDDTKEIAGYTCNKAIITQVGNEKNSFPVYYTKGINMVNPNWNLPYDKIDGVLMEYQIKHKDMVMFMKAKKVNLNNIEDEEFEINSEFKVVQKEELPEIIQSFF